MLKLCLLHDILAKPMYHACTAYMTCLHNVHDMLAQGFCTRSISQVPDWWQTSFAEAKQDRPGAHLEAHAHRLARVHDHPTSQLLHRIVCNQGIECPARHSTLAASMTATGRCDIPGVVSHSARALVDTRSKSLLDHYGDINTLLPCFA